MAEEPSLGFRIQVSGCRCRVLFAFQRPQHRPGRLLFPVPDLVDLFRFQVRPTLARQEKRMGGCRKIDL